MREAKITDLPDLPLRSGLPVERLIDDGGYRGSKMTVAKSNVAAEMFRAMTVLQAARSAWAARLAGTGCAGLLLWSMWLGSAVLHSPNREMSFHGAMAAADSQYRSTLRILAMSHERFSAAFDLRNAPDYVVFHLMLGGTLGAKSELSLESFSFDGAAQTIVVAGRKRNTPASGDRTEVRVLIEPDPKLGSRFRIMGEAPGR